jgi:peptide deformylase
MAKAPKGATRRRAKLGRAGRMPIALAGDPVLRERARRLSAAEIRSAAIQRLIASMKVTMRAAPGVGLAAPQIGMPLQLAVIEDRAEYQRRLSARQRRERQREPVEFHVIANPRLRPLGSRRVAFFEGCLSVPGLAARVARYEQVEVECLNEEGRPQTIVARGWYARILQHEIDHLLGILYVDRMEPRTLTTLENQAMLAEALGHKDRASARRRRKRPAG